MLTLTRSDRLARQLREDLSLSRLAEGQLAWESPAIARLADWVREVWVASWPPEQLLNTIQERALWRQVIDTDDETPPLLSTAAVAREALRCDQWLLRAGLNPPFAGFASPERRLFLRWRERVRSRSASEGWLSAAQLPEAVVQGLRCGRVLPPAAVRLVGFGGCFEPFEQRVIEALASAGSRIEEVPAPRLEPKLHRQVFADAQDQFRAIALDLRQRLAAYADHRNSPPRILLALPDPESRRELIETLFRDLLTPLVAGASAAPRRPWRWERGRPLGAHPWIASAQALIGLEAGANPWSRVSSVLLSPVLWSPAERRITAEADWTLRKRGLPQPSLARLRQALVGGPGQRFDALALVLAAEPKRAWPSDWATHFQARLDALGWPGAMALDSSAYQAVREWTRALQRLTTLDLPMGRVTAASARGLLAEVLSDTPFEPRADHLQPITILSLEEAAGLSCDVLYLADLNADRFPSRPAPSPFLDLEFQIRNAWPGAHAPQVLADARRLAAGLLGSAPEVWLSAPGIDERGAETPVSSLFGPSADWPGVHVERSLSTLERTASGGVRSVPTQDDPVPAVGPEELAGLRADTALFQAWFQAPFFAFCRYRLGIEPLQQPGPGLNAAGQGQVAHAALEQLWAELSSREHLLACPAERLREAILAALGRVLPAQMDEADYGRVAIRLEFDRQADLLTQWLNHERRRVDDFQVLAVEKRFSTEVAGLPLRLRIDRIDRVQFEGSQRWLVIDYKTGTEADHRGWNAEKLLEPQLPLYASFALAAEAGISAVDGICFAHLKDGHPALVAATNWRQHLIEPQTGKFHSDWPGDLRAWREALEAAARGFLAGDATLRAELTQRSVYADLLWLTGREVGAGALSAGSEE